MRHFFKITKMRSGSGHIKVGKLGEKISVRLLKAKGYEILFRNFRCDKGEIDIVARDGNILVFVEVKTRSERALFRPAVSLSHRQKLRIKNAARRYINEISIKDPVYRFDVIEIFLSRFGFARVIKHWKRYF